MRRPASSRSEVIVAAMSVGKSAAAQSALIPRPMTARGSAVPRPVGLAQHAADLADPAGTALVTRRDDQVVRPLEPDGPGRQPGGRFGRLGHRHATRRPPAARPGRAPARWAGTRATPAAPRRAARPRRRPSRPRPAVCSSATRRQTSGVPAASQSRTTSFVEPTRAKCSRRARNGVIDGASLIRPPPRRRRWRRPARVVRARRRRAARAARSRGRPRRSCR